MPWDKQSALHLLVGLPSSQHVCGRLGGFSVLVVPKMVKKRFDRMVSKKGSICFPFFLIFVLWGQFHMIFSFLFPFFFVWFVSFQWAERAMIFIKFNLKQFFDLISAIFFLLFLFLLLLLLLFLQLVRPDQCIFSFSSIFFSP